MSIAENLLRLHRWQLDERSRYLAELESLAERLRGDVRRLAAKIEAAAGVAGPDRLTLGAALIERREKLQHSIAEIEDQIVEARAAVAAVEHEIQVWELAATAQRTGPQAGGVFRRPQPAGQLPLSSILSRRYGS